jgi:hypothetical protein
MLDAWNRVEHYGYLAEECRHLATSTISSEIKSHYLLLANIYILLAGIEERALLARTHAPPLTSTMVAENTSARGAL